MNHAEGWMWARQQWHVYAVGASAVHLHAGGTIVPTVFVDAVPDHATKEAGGAAMLLVKSFAAATAHMRYLISVLRKQSHSVG
jgi:hypothetical protein